jgi:transcriptional regulator with XRE-family HTH domain
MKRATGRPARGRPARAAVTPAIDASTETGAPAALPRDPSPGEFGRRLKMLRLSRGLTLKDLEERGGISATHVSEIERGKASPTVGALGRIALALGMRPATLLEPLVLPDVTEMSAAVREARQIQWGSARIMPVSEGVRGAELSAQILILPVGRAAALTHSHEGEEWATVLSGVAEIRVDDEPYMLREGESLHFRAHRVHAYSNPASAPAMLLIACRPRLAI